MYKPARKRCLQPTVVALAVLGAWGPVWAEGSTASASVDFGFGLLSGDNADRALFGQYNGLRNKDAVGLLGFGYERRNVEAGTAVMFEGLNLLGEVRDLDFSWKKQGDWKFSADYAERVRYDPLDSSADGDLKVQRTQFGMAYQKVISPRLQFDVSLRSEDKEGSRLFGIGMNCPSTVAPDCGRTTGTEVGWAVLMRPEPIDANHSQVEARVSYVTGQLALSGGYYGSFYRNRYGSLDPNVPSSLNNALGTRLPLSAGLQDILNQPVALAPDNQAQQIDLTGSYAFAPKARLNFKLAYGTATQDQNFVGAGFNLAPAGVSNLGGRVDTTLAQVGLTASPLPKTTVRAKLRYNDRDDRTPLALYNVEGDNRYTNRRLPNTKTSALLEASYQFTNDYRGTFGADYEAIDRGTFTATSAVAGITALRQKTDETGLRAELRRRMSESFSGSIGLYSSRRDGSNWLRNNSGLGVTPEPDPNDPATGFATGIFMPTLADRQRDKVKLMANWLPMEELSLQLSAQTGRDRFDPPSAYGLRKAGMDNVSLDASYAYSLSWSFTGYLSYGNETLLQARPGAAVMSLDNTSTGVGLGVTGKISSSLQVGGSVSYIDDRSKYGQTLDATADGANTALLAATGGLPDIVFRQGISKLYARYVLNKQTDVQFDLTHQRSTWTDWGWAYGGTPFSYSDGTTVGQKELQSVTYIGLRYIYRWQP
ncbi:MAG: MtrB/PioB family decaheme-associated outer membrane protein [Rubrivivax sp.]|nr:MtrB/PioB family decaheme-associated outer membrane protein [Rubrivivax sp.]